MLVLGRWRGRVMGNGKWRVSEDCSVGVCVVSWVG
jgi:predicted secreted protein